MKKETIVFHPMSKVPARDPNDRSFSKTVLVYSEESEFFELGYFDFEDECWHHFSSNSFLFKCWCYIPDPSKWLQEHPEWPSVKNKGYKEPLYVKNGKL